jgi:hypothetical protein
VTFQKAIFLLVTLSIASSRAQAGEIEPRAYMNTPVGVNFFLMGYVRSDGGLSTPASSPIENANLKMDTEIFAYARTLDVMGKSAKIDIVVPYSDLSGSALVSGVPLERKVDGFIDPRFRFSINFFGAPALSLKDFASYQQDLIIGASVQVSAPLGQYDQDKLVNLGANRWFIKPEIGISKAWGPLALELSGGVFLYTNNNNYFGGKTLEQDPLFTSQAHLTYNILPGMWAALSASVDRGGQTRVNGVRNYDSQNNSRAGFTFVFSLDKKNSLKLYASNAMHTNIGTAFDLYGIVWQYRWGGGL